MSDNPVTPVIIYSARNSKLCIGEDDNMKTILVLTDLTENAAHAARAGVRLGEKLGANILLLNVNTSQPVMPQYFGDPTAVDTLDFWEAESRKRLHQLSRSLESLLVQRDPQLRGPNIESCCGEGNVAMAIEEVMARKDIELIVMGARGGSTIDHIFAGSETVAVIDKSAKPILIVPLNADLNKLAKIVYATDFNQADLSGLRYLVKLAKLFNAHVEVVHVNLYHDQEDSSKLERERVFLKEIRNLNYPKISIREVHGKEVTSRLNTLCEESVADVLAFMHYKNSFFKRLFKHSTTLGALTDQKIPLLILPSEMTD